VDKTRFGILGFAHMHAHGYARALKKSPDADLVGIFDDDRARGRGAATEYGVGYFDDPEKLLRDDIDAVIVCSPNSKHADLAIRAAESGKHVLCEKPIATTLEDANDMVRAARSSGVILEIAFVMRYSAPVLRVKDLLDQGVVGEILAMRGANRGKMPEGWFLDIEKAGGGAVMDHTVHLVDLMRWFTTSEVIEVYADMDTLLHDIAVEDCGLLALQFQSGAIASLDPSWSRPAKYPQWGDVTMEILGGDGSLYLDAFNQNVYLCSDKGVCWSNWGEDTDSEMVGDFIHCVTHNAEPRSTGEDGLRSLEIALAAYRSAKEKRVIKLPLEG